MNPAKLPKNEALNRELESLNNEYVDLYTRHRELVDNDTPLLMSKYMERIGYLQVQLLEKRTEASRLNMKIKMIQKVLNRDEEADLEAIEKELDKKLEEYYREIKRQAELLDESKKLLEDLLPEEETEELRTLFRLLCKRLHPDLNPNLTEEEKELFVRVKTAYDLRKLSELQEIYLFLESSEKRGSLDLTVDDKAERVRFLKERINDLKEKIGKLYNWFPLNIEEELKDESWIEEQKQEINIQIKIVEEKIEEYNKMLGILMQLI